MTSQICTQPFVSWLDTTAFHGYVQAGDLWDDEVAWPDEKSMTAARSCFAAFADGDLKLAEQQLLRAQAIVEGSL